MTMGSGIREAVVQFLEEEHFQHWEMEGKPVMRWSLSVVNGTYECYAHMMERQERLIVYSVLPFYVPAPKRLVVAEFITRANYGMILGNFEMDFSDGEVRFRTSVDVEGGVLTAKMVRTLVYVNINMIDSYYPGVMAVVFANLNPAQAISRVEGRN